MFMDFKKSSQYRVSAKKINTLKVIKFVFGWGCKLFANVYLTIVSDGGTII
jgi:hypothetical protein